MGLIYFGTTKFYNDANRPCSTQTVGFISESLNICNNMASVHWVGEQLKKVELVDCGGLELNPRPLTQTRDGNIARLSGNRISGAFFGPDI